MIFRNVLFKTKFIFLLLSIFLITINSHAQSNIDINNLSNVKIDELSDEEIRVIFEKGVGSGFTANQAEKLAKSKGLPAQEAVKLNERLTKMGLSTENMSTNANSDTTIKQKEEEKENLDVKVPKIEPKAIKKDKELQAYGYDIFKNGNIKFFDKATDAKAKDNYIIGVGDELILSVYGYSYYNEVLKVDSRGRISPSQMGPIYVKGLTFEKARQLIKSKMNQFYDLSNNKFELALAYSRNINVNIVGEVAIPGSYNIPAINSVFNALIIAGGPTEIGSLRSIQIRRSGKTIKTIDIYSFLNDPNSNEEFYLEENDYIVIPPLGATFHISGEVKRPMIYELKESENLNKLLFYAGGISPNAYLKNIRITRINQIGVSILDVNLDSLIKNKKDYKLQSGDRVVIRSTSDEVTNIVNITGAVQLEGGIQFVDGDRVTDLIRKAGGLKKDALLEKAYLIRTKSNQEKETIIFSLKNILENPSSTENVKIMDRDSIIVSSYNDFKKESIISVFGEAKMPGNFEFIEGMTLGNALFLSGGLKYYADNMRVEISRISLFSKENENSNTSRVIIERINVPKDLMLEDNQMNLKLQPFDQIFIRKVPDFELQRNMKIIGEVKYPGMYTIISKDERVSNVIKRAGGLSRFAFVEGASLYRKGLDGGYIVLRLDKALKSENSKYNYTLKEGDILTIPTVIDFVAIRGSSLEYLNIVDQSQVNAPFVKGKRAKYYINEFGNGFSEKSWRKKTYVIDNNAKINKTKNYLLFKIYPKVSKGSVIYVVNKPAKPQVDLKERKPFDWNRFIENTTIKVTGIATLFLIFRQL